MQEGKLTLKIPDSLLIAGFRLKELQADAAQRLALSYYADGILSFGQAAKMCDMTAWEFSNLLAHKKVHINYDLEDIEKELELGKELGYI
ncbi:protein of unknown function UPF0175 [Desulfotomaculum nigrificans CO-1-SRB]|uniref:Uncharacterized protein n=2 Tax=Eubacteriales TaxID=186802 RepID=K8EDG6_9FIRM|nr:MULTISPECIES: UPF0175 family protein [Eubacteriales]AEF94466.1 protein of unknown function UPF0175 [Desulfotomaculum nigrificans CO-1-SRB]CCO06861.1 conserved hypothetical protein [Desulforamulus hydrothermalis Lam5 = DSM 18033]SHH46027.1 Uncharacterised protein family (UPF0175) [Desulforamulus hydrothermalis Lam5 = DSM 18033]